MKFLIRIIASAATLFASATHAQTAEFVGTGDWVGPIEIRAPQTLTEDDSIAIEIPYDGCSYQDAAEVYPWTSTIRRAGNEITVYVYRSQIVCFSTGSFAEWIYSPKLGRLPAGTYSVTVRYRSQFDPVEYSPFLTLQTSIEVARGKGIPTALPSLSSVASSLLAAMLAMAGLLFTRSRRAKLTDGSV